MDLSPVRWAALIAVASAYSLASPGVVFAQAVDPPYPTRPVRLVIGFARAGQTSSRVR